ncbi:MAG: dTDP-4-dehydrorhamnose reductase [Venatoribacter sp.]
MNKLRVLVTGAAGQLGQALQASELPYQFIFLDKDQLDVCDVVQIQKAFLCHKPHVVIHAAAFTGVDSAEENDDQAFEINEWGSASIAKMCAKKNSKMIYLSSDYVFNGTQHSPYTEDAQPEPVNLYGESKLAGETRVLKELGTRALVIRTSWLFSEFGHNFVKTMVQHIKAQCELRVISDQIGSPTYAVDLADWLVQLIPLLWQGRASGIYHASGSGSCSWYELAQTIAAQLLERGVIQQQARIHPVTASDYAAKAVRPAYSALNNQKLAQALGINIHSWQQMLKRCLEHI